ncbi:MAG: hypothetical protein CMH54_10505 [Myxococcales bacterium]|nr:hypothetical protein [Myxococcales bacterium]
MRSTTLLILFLWACGGGGATTADQGTNPADGAQSDTGTSTNEIHGEEIKADVSIPGCEPGLVPVPSENFFTDISDQSGIRVGNYSENPPVGTIINDHSRLGFADINGDGFDDIVMHSLYPNPQNGVPFEHLVFMNNGDGTFSDFSDESGLRNVQSGFFAFGDVDNDGDQDVFSGIDIPFPGLSHQIFLNDGEGHFEAVIGSGFESYTNKTHAGNAVFADFNNDTTLDLYMGNGHTGGGITAAEQIYDGLFLGDGTGSFVDMSANLQNNPPMLSNGTVVCDYDDDGDLDIFVSVYGVSNGNGRNILWRNNNGSFENVAVDAGFASQAGGNPYLASTGYGLDPEPGKGPTSYMGGNGFGLACADINNDGYMDIFQTSISHPEDGTPNRKWSDPSLVLINSGPEGGFTFTNEGYERGLPFAEGDVDGAVVDFDNDGRLDLSLSRDSKYDSSYDPVSQIEQRSWFGLMHQQADGSFQSVGIASGINIPDIGVRASLTSCVNDSTCTEAGEQCLKDRCRHPCTTASDCTGEHEYCHAQGFCKHLATMKKAQNHAWSDIDHDGDLDLLVGGRDTGGGRPNFLFRNDIGSSNRWIGLQVSGDGVAVHRDAVGTRVQIRFADGVMTRHVHLSRGMHNSMDSKALLFGLGDFPCTYTVEVRWPDGTEVSFASGSFSEKTYLKLSYPDQLTP